MEDGRSARQAGAVPDGRDARSTSTRRKRRSSCDMTKNDKHITDEPTKLI